MPNLDENNCIVNYCYFSLYLEENFWQYFLDNYLFSGSDQCFLIITIISTGTKGLSFVFVLYIIYRNNIILI